MSPVDPYRESGVDIEKGNRLVDWLKDGTAREDPTCGQVISGIGGFAGLFEPNLKKYSQPVLVSSTDGVGTKLLLGLQYHKLEGLGTDLVAMCVNDLYTVGARPLFFLDYFATGLLDEEQFKAVLSGINHGLSLCSTAMLGGETAELPGLYKKGHFDLAGFVVGVVDKDKKLGPHLVQKDDVLIGIASQGFHANGYSLIRKWLQDTPPDESLIDHLLMPTKIYSFIPELIETFEGQIHAAAHITGGGLKENLGRVLPRNLQAQVKSNAIQTPDWMRKLILNHVQNLGQVEKVFNMGIGMILAVSKDSASAILAELHRAEVTASIIGNMVSRQTSNDNVIYI